MSSCLTDIEHRGLLSGELDETDAARVRRHLAECEYCVRQRETLITRHDIWVQRIREAGPPRLFGELFSDAPTSLPGEGIIAGYEIKEELSRGGQGIVYRAIQRSTKREVAIKVLLEGPFASRDARRRFEREIELVAGFKHPNIVTVFDSGMMSDGRQYCVMDHVSGIRLDRYIADHCLGIKEALGLFVMVCDAVNYAHRRGVIHRDLKPSNILVDEQGQPRVLDFGMAKQLDDPGDTQLTAIGIVAGTLPYLSPELARRNHSDVDIRTDVYSLGVVLYEILTGRYPHSMSGDIIEVLKRIADTPPISPSRTTRSLQTNAGKGPRIEPLPSRGHRERLNPDVGTILLKALAQSQEHRYQSAGDMARDIRHYLDGEPIEARGDSTWYALKMGVRRYKWPVAAAALFILLITGSAIALALIYGRQGRLLVEVEQQKTLAQNRFEDVRSLARTLIFGMENDLSATHISATARAFLVKTALKYLNTLAQDTSLDDTQMMGELGAAYFSLGDIQGDPLNTNLGDRAGAMESYEKGLGYLEAVVKGFPEDLDAQRELSVALLHIGTLLESMGRREKARGYFRRSYQLTDRLVSIQPDDRSLQRDHVMNQRIMADYELSDGHTEESLALFKSALKATESLAQADTEKEHLQHDLAAINGKIGICWN